MTEMFCLDIQIVYSDWIAGKDLTLTGKKLVNIKYLDYF